MKNHMDGSVSIKSVFRMVIAFVPLLMFSCVDHGLRGDEYFTMASDKVKQDSIIQAYSLAEKALDEYVKSGNESKQIRARILLSLLYYSTGQKDVAYETIANLGGSAFSEEDYPLYSNYYRIKAQHLSAINENREEALGLMDSVLHFDTLYAKGNSNIVNLDRLNKCEILLNFGETAPVSELLESIGAASSLPNTLEPQLYANLARWYEINEMPDSAYAYASRVFGATSKIYEDVDNSFYAINVMLRYDSLSNNMQDYIRHRNLLEKYREEVQGERVKYGMAFAREQNVTENLRIRAKAERKAWIFIAISIFLVAMILLLVLIQKHKNVVIKNRMTQLECDRLDAEAFRRKLENELLTRKINSKSGELKRANEEILELSRQLAQNGQPEASDCDSYLQKLLNRLHTDHPDFVSRLDNRFPSLTKTESILASLIKLNLSSDEIITAMSISKSGLIKARYRLRKKLNIDSSAELDDLITSL